MSRPATIPRWATSGSADISTPPSQKRAGGWVAEDIPPAGWINWFWHWVGEWTAYLDGLPAVYQTIEAATLDSSAGDLVIVDEADSTAGAAPGDTNFGQLSAAGALTDGIASVCCTGKSVIYAPTGAGNPVEVARDTFNTTIRTYVKTISAGAGNFQVLTDGGVLILICGRYVEAFNVHNGTVRWTIDLGALAAAQVGTINKGRLILGGSVAVPADPNVWSYALSDGALHWSIPHGASVDDVCAAGSRVFIAGSASTFASGANLRAVIFDSGADATGECGTLDTSGRAWDRVLATKPTNLASDGHMLYLGSGTAAATQLEACGMADGVSVWTMPIAGYSCNQLACDQDSVIWCGTDAGSLGTILAADLKAPARRWQRKDSTYDIPACAADGSAVFYSRQNMGGSGDPTLYRVYRGNRPGFWRRVGPDDSGDLQPIRQLLIPGA